MKTKIYRFVSLSAAVLLAPLAFSQSNLVQVGYSFNQGPGDLPANRVVIDYYQNLNGTFDGNVTNAPLTPGFTSQPGDYSLTPKWGSFTGQNAYTTFAINQIAGFATSWSDFTMEMHFKPGTANASLITFDTTNGGKFKIMGGSNTRLRVFERDGASYYTNPLNADQWYHFAITYSAETNEIRTYLNGVQFGSAITVDLSTLLGAPEKITLGANYTTGTGVGGIWDKPIDDFRFTNAVLTPGQFLTEGFGNQTVIPEGRVAFLLGVAALVVAARCRVLRKR